MKLMSLKKVNFVKKFYALLFPEIIYINRFKKFYKSSVYLFFIFLSPIFALLQRFIAPLILIRVGKIYNHRLGHFILEFDWYHAYETKNIKKRTSRFPMSVDFFFLSSNSSNTYLEEVARKSLKIFPREILLGIFLLNKFILKNRKYLVDFPKRPTDLTYLDKCASSCVLSSEENDIGEKELVKLGLNPEQEMVCFFIRDASYERHYFPDRDPGSTRYRNSDPALFEKGMEFLANKGFIVFRMGKTAEKPLGVKHSNIIDYSYSAIKSDFMDFYLSSKCKFAVATDSGSMMLPILFRKPLFLANIPGFHGLLQGECVTLFQFKTFINLDSGDEISLQDLLQKNFSIIDSSNEFESARIGLLENNPDEILYSIIEMLDLLNSKSNLKMKYQKSQQLLNLRLESSITKEITGLLSNSWIEKHPKFLN
jgi:putative glycosyltransferase (TIGR04372 family)